MVLVPGLARVEIDIVIVPGGRVKLSVSAPGGRVKSSDSKKPKSDYKMSDLGFCL